VIIWLVTTKYLDSETGLYYYGLRYYIPPLARWLNRDPLEQILLSAQQSFRHDELMNLYKFTSNSAVSSFDYLGLAGCSCGPDVTDGLNNALAEANRRFSDASFPDKIKGCLGFWFPLPAAKKNWDLKFQTTCGSCPKGDSCKETVTVAGKCHYLWDVNYILYGKSQQLCGSTLKSMHKNIILWKWFLKAFDNIIEHDYDGFVGDPNSLIEWSPDIHGWAQVGYLNLPLRFMPERKALKSCDACKDPGTVEIRPWWPW